MNGLLTLWWGDPALAGQYRADLLHGADRRRAEMARSPRAELDWRVSRTLLRQALAAAPSASPAMSISHSRGHALVATAPAGWRIGVDLEAIRPRDTARLAPWCCSEEEAGALASHGSEAERLRAFYALWTLKESFVKAAGLAFPADMRKVGLTGTGPPWAEWRLRAPGPGWRAWSAIIDDAWLASVAWLPSDAPVQASTTRPEAPQWRTAQGVASPSICPAGRWS